MIVKMKFLSITGPKADIDRVVNTYLSKYEIHLENALTELSTMQNITPYIQINPYKETLKQAEDFTALLPEEKRTTTKRLSLEDAINCVHGLDHTLGQLNQERTELEAKKKDLMEKAQKIEPFQDLHCNLSSILDFHFIKFRFGKITKEYYNKLRATAMRTAIRYSTAAIPMSSMYGAFTSAQEIRSRKWTPYSHPCTSKESTFRTSTAERRRMLTQHFRQKSKRQTMHSASAHGNWQNAFRIPQRIWLQQKSS